MTAAPRVGAAARATTGAVLPAHRPREESRHVADLSQPARAKAAGVSVRTQRKLDRLARERPDLLAEVRAGRLSAHRAAIEAGVVRKPTEDGPDRAPWQAVREAVARIAGCPLPADRLAADIPLYRVERLGKDARAASGFLTTLAEHLDRRCGGCLDRQRPGDRP
jgi:hypothetical protein